MAAPVPRYMQRQPARAGLYALLAFILLVATAPWHRRRQSAPRACGSAESGLPRRGRVYLHYVAPRGLCNQLNSHITAFTLADALGVDAIIVPPAQHRRSFNHSTTDSSVYYNASASTLLDMPAIRDAWAPLGIRVLEEGVHAEDQEWRGCVAAHLHNPPAPPYVPPGLQTGLGNLIARVRSLIGDAWRSHGTQACVVVHAGELLFALRTQTSANLTAAAAGRLAFAPGIEALALEVADGIGGPYNGAHLRVEKDMGLNPMDVMPNYVAAMQLQAFNASMPVYVASGLLTYNDTQGLQSLSKYMLSSGVASRVVVKEQLLPPADLEGLHSEQRALLDLLVLARAQRFVGHRVSTFSHYTTQYQLLRNGDSSRAALLNHPGTDFWHEFMDIVPMAYT